jgi:uncharacterized protein
MHAKLNALSKKKLEVIIEKYSYAPDFFDQNIVDQNSRNVYGDQLLHAACVTGDIEDVEFLLTVNSDINSKGGMGYTPLHYAVEQAKTDLVKFLLKKGADKSIKNVNGESPRELAILLNYPEILELLESYQ